MFKMNSQPLIDNNDDSQIDEENMSLSTLNLYKKLISQNQADVENEPVVTFNNTKPSLEQVKAKHEIGTVKSLIGTAADVNLKSIPENIVTNKERSEIEQPDSSDLFRSDHSQHDRNTEKMGEYHKVYE